jgi:hypothetical protein
MISLCEQVDIRVSHCTVACGFLQIRSVRAEIIFGQLTLR